MDVAIGIVIVGLFLFLLLVVALVATHVEYALRLSTSRFGPHKRMLFVRRIHGPEQVDLASILTAEGWTTKETTRGVLATRLRSGMPGVPPWSLARATRQASGSWLVEVGVWGSMMSVYSLMVAFTASLQVVVMLRGTNGSSVGTELFIAIGIVAIYSALRFARQDAERLRRRLHSPGV